MSAKLTPARGAEGDTKRKRQIVGLDLIRGSAALLVVLFHLGVWAWWTPGLKSAPALNSMRTTPLFSAGWVGVEIFFVISGFVIAYSTEGATPGRFVRHRFLRLFPAALVCATITCAFRTIVAYPFQQTSMEWLRSVTFFPVGPWVDGPYWTLPIEVTFYLLVLLTLFWARARYLPTVMMAVGVVSTATCLVLFFEPKAVPFAVLSFLASCWFPPGACLLLVYGCFFSLGVLLFFCLLHGFTSLRAIGLGVSLVGCIAEVQWHERGPVLAYHRASGSVIPLIVWSIAVLLLVASVLWNAEFQELVGSRGVSLSRRIGLTTYPLYLLHANIGEWLVIGLYRHLGYALSICLVLCVMVIAAGVIAIKIEPWVRERLRSLGEAARRGRATA